MKKIAFVIFLALISCAKEPIEAKHVQEKVSHDVLLSVQEDLNDSKNYVYKKIDLATQVKKVETEGKDVVVIIPREESPIEKYLDKTKYKTLVSKPLIDDGLVETATSTTIVDYNSNYKLYFGFNDTDKTVAIAQSQQEADALAQKERAVYYALLGETLKQTITRWANYSGYKVYYLAQKEIIINEPATFFGKISDHDGSLSQLMKAVSQVGVSIKAEFTSNKILVIKDNAYSPLILVGGQSNA